MFLVYYFGCQNGCEMFVFGLRQVLQSSMLWSVYLKSIKNLNLQYHLYQSKKLKITNMVNKMVNKFYFPRIFIATSYFKTF